MRKIEVKWEGIKSYKDENGEEIPEKSGVYEILIKDAEEWKKRYVGSTDDLQRRFYEHLSENEENENIKEGLKKYVCGFDFALISDEDDRLDAEQGLYDKRTYSWNKERPEGSGDENYEISET